jgi:hypothetical protein
MQRIAPTFTVSTDTKYLDNAKYEQEYSNPDTNVDIISPKSDGDTSSGKFEGQNSQPTNSVIPACSESTATMSARKLAM